RQERWMSQTSQQLHLSPKALHESTGQSHREQFKDHLGLEGERLSQIDRDVMPAPKQRKQAVASNLLSHAIIHHLSPCHCASRFLSCITCCMPTRRGTHRGFLFTPLFSSLFLA